MPAWNPHDDGSWPDDFRAIRWGVYLRPDARTCRDQTVIHDLLERQFGLVAGGAFMPHATIKGFTLSRAGADTIIGAVDPVVARHPAFPVYNGGPHEFSPGNIALDVQHLPDGHNNDRLTAFATDMYDAILPFVEPDDRFTTIEPARERFHGHLTLAMADCPPWLAAELREFVGELTPIGSPEFLARYIHLFAFTSEAWEGPWWESLRWRLLHTWTLAGGTEEPRDN